MQQKRLRKSGALFPDLVRPDCVPKWVSLFVELSLFSYLFAFRSWMLRNETETCRETPAGFLNFYFGLCPLERAVRNQEFAYTKNSDSLAVLPAFEMPNCQSPIAVTALPASTAACVDSSANRERLIMEHLPTVRLIARRMHKRLPQHVELEDLISAGTIGLLDAVEKFDNRKEVQFKSYAQFRIRGAILDSMRLLDWSPRELRRKSRAIEGVIQALSARHGEAPTEAEIASALDLSLDEYQRLLGQLKGLEIGSLQAERSEESGEEELSYVPGPASDDPLFRCIEGEMKARLVEALDDLPEKERLVLTLYYFEELTMKEIGATIGVVESRVSQLRASAVVRLRSALAAGHQQLSK